MTNNVIGRVWLFAILLLALGACRQKDAPRGDEAGRSSEPVSTKSLSVQFPAFAVGLEATFTPETEQLKAFNFKLTDYAKTNGHGLENGDEVRLKMLFAEEGKAPQVARNVKGEDSFLFEYREMAGEAKGQGKLYLKDTPDPKGKLPEMATIVLKIEEGGSERDTKLYDQGDYQRLAAGSWYMALIKVPDGASYQEGKLSLGARALKTLPRSTEAGRSTSTVAELVDFDDIPFVTSWQKIDMAKIVENQHKHFDRYRPSFTLKPMGYMLSVAIKNGLTQDVQLQNLRVSGQGISSVAKIVFPAPDGTNMHPYFEQGRPTTGETAPDTEAPIRYTLGSTALAQTAESDFYHLWVYPTGKTAPTEVKLTVETLEGNASKVYHFSQSLVALTEAQYNKGYARGLMLLAKNAKDPGTSTTPKLPEDPDITFLSPEDAANVNPNAPVYAFPDGRRPGEPGYQPAHLFTENYKSTYQLQEINRDLADKNTYIPTLNALRMYLPMGDPYQPLRIYQDQLNRENLGDQKAQTRSSTEMLEEHRWFGVVKDQKTTRIITRDANMEGEAATWHSYAMSPSVTTETSSDGRRIERITNQQQELLHMGVPNEEGSYENQRFMFATAEYIQHFEPGKPSKIFYGKRFGGQSLDSYYPHLPNDARSSLNEHELSDEMSIESTEGYAVHLLTENANLSAWRYELTSAGLQMEIAFLGPEGADTSIETIGTEAWWETKRATGLVKKKLLPLGTYSSSSYDPIGMRWIAVIHVTEQGIAYECFGERTWWKKNQAGELKFLLFNKKDGWTPLSERSKWGLPANN